MCSEALLQVLAGAGETLLVILYTLPVIHYHKCAGSPSLDHGRKGLVISHIFQ